MEQLTAHDQQYFNTLPLEDLLKFTNHTPFNFIVNNGWIDSIEWVEKNELSSVYPSVRWKIPSYLNQGKE